MNITDKIEFDEGVELDLQNEDFKAWFNENVRPKINFASGDDKTCTTEDLFGRPDSWVFPELTVKAEYYSNEGYKLDFNKFTIYGTI